jgi:hypothetical protein
MKSAHPGRLWFLAVPLAMAFFFVYVDSRLTPVDGPDPNPTNTQNDKNRQANRFTIQAGAAIVPITPTQSLPLAGRATQSPAFLADPQALPYPLPSDPASFSASSPVTQPFVSPPRSTAAPRFSPLTSTAILYTAPLTQMLSATIQVSATFPSLAEFIAQTANGEAGALSGLYADGLLALRIVQQPPGEPSFISTDEGTATQFQTPSLFGVVGLLAHNFLSGRDFLRLSPRQEIALVYGDRHIQRYRVSQIADFQRLNPADLSSNFLDLAAGQELTTEQVFASFYQGKPHLTLQTCIQRNGDWSWGVRFIVAEPLSEGDP